MASIYKRGRVWWLSYYANGRHRCESLKTDSQKVAEAVRRKYEYELVTKTLKIQDKVELEPLITEYLKDVEARCSEKTLETGRSFLRRFLKNTGFVWLNQLTPGTVQDYFRQLQLDGRKPTTMNRYRECLHAFINYAIRSGTWVLENPVSKVPRQRCPDPVICFLTLEQIDTQLRKLEKERCIHAMVATMIYAGLRREEVTWLTPKDVDLKVGTIFVTSKSDWCSKTKRNRSIPISKALQAILTRFLLWRRRHHSECPWFFPSPKGQRWDPDNFSTDLRALNKAAKLKWATLVFRHTFGSHLAQKGVSLYKISELMGNSPEIARRHYAALVPDRMREDVEFAQLDGDDARLQKRS